VLQPLGGQLRFWQMPTALLPCCRCCCCRPSVHLGLLLLAVAATAQPQLAQLASPPRINIPICSEYQAVLASGRDLNDRVTGQTLDDTWSADCVGHAEARGAKSASAASIHHSTAAAGAAGAVGVQNGKQ
jgi:hypothetical protein